MRFSLLNKRAAAFLLLPLFAVGCGDTEEGDATGTPTAEAVTDLRFEIPAPPESGLQFVSEDMVIPGGMEQQWCFFFTYEGPDVGITVAKNWQNTDYGHHAVLMQYTGDGADPIPDGTVMDCTSEDSLTMTDVAPIYIAADDGGPGYSEMNLPDGFATSLKGGTRMILQSHYVNYSPNPILTRDVVNLDFIPSAEVETWVAPWVHAYVRLDLPAGTDSTLSFDCTWGDDLGPLNADIYLLNMLGHMHDYGTAFNLRHASSDRDMDEIVYDLPVWDPEFRDTPPVEGFTEDEYLVKAGDVFTTTCHWFNSTDHALGFPSEMCVSTGMAYSKDVALKAPMICDPS